MLLRTFFLFAAALAAAVVPELTFEDLAAQSVIAVHGRVVRSWSAWDSKHKYIWTHHEIEVLDSLDGVPRSKVTASEPGGEVEGFGMRISGEVPYAPGEEIIVFLYRTPAGYFRSTGFGQGKYTVQGGRVRNNFRGTELVSPNGRPPRGTSLRSLDNLELEAFKRQVRAVMRARKTR